jgi:hypothetical protein
VLGAAAADEWRAFAASALAQDRRIVATEDLGEAPPPWAVLLRHERIPFVSYPYEWPFSLLKRAALLQLDLLTEAIGAGLILKDASPYNVQWNGASPVFIDVGSFERLREGEAWAGYRQFCQLQLYPLMLQAFRNVPYQPWLRGAIDGITPAEMRALLRLRDRRPARASRAPLCAASGGGPFGATRGGLPARARACERARPAPARGAARLARLERGLERLLLDLHL